MFTNNMNLSGNKMPILVPPNSSPNITSNAQQHGNNRSLNLSEHQHQQQQLTLDSPRLPLSSNSNNASYKNESSLLMCGPNTNGPQNTHLNPNSSLTSTIAAPNNGPYPPPTMPPLYQNSPSSLSNTGTGKL